MAELQIVYWRDIPAQVIVRQGRRTARRELPKRFIEAVDMCAMRVGAKDSDAYLAEWRRASAEREAEDLEGEADRAAAEIDSAYDMQRLRSLIDNAGRET
ncbi:virulence factor [Aurantimonas sp. HBX-1]|uniref:virulence factor n=1 Tax=Aurantimonas sp. HBX-1 TaxID=2906072 RepID=UPI001F29FD28|nr:virulence factor [Aurantimonas sp. HBX-1]UIJ73975.1 virulence factor [Aurantimonas sp. HBX-1]